MTICPGEKIVPLQTLCYLLLLSLLLPLTSESNQEALPVAVKILSHASTDCIFEVDPLMWAGMAPRSTPLSVWQLRSSNHSDLQVFCGCWNVFWVFRE